MQGIGRPSKGLIAFFVCGHGVGSQGLVQRRPCEGLRICNGAPDEAGQKAVYGANSKYGQRVATAKSCCYGGLRHSIKLYSPRMPTDWNCRGQTDPAIQAAVKANRPIKIV